MCEHTKYNTIYLYIYFIIVNGLHSFGNVYKLHNYKNYMNTIYVIKIF